MKLKPQFDSKKSFYDKATTRTEKNGQIILKSYNTDVAWLWMQNNKAKLPIVRGYYSRTTLRHIKEFLKQHGFKADSKKQILEDYRWI